MSDYFESEIEPIFGIEDESQKNTYAQKENNSVRIYYFCEKCGKKGHKSKKCCGVERTKGYDL